ncbi:MAG: alginate export family protein [Myxococcota bacterium]
MLLVPVALAEEDAPVRLVPVAEVRPRAEVRATLDGSDPAMGVNQRTRLGGVVSVGPNVAAEVVLQDVRVWGEEAHTLTDYSAGGVDVHAAAVRWTPSKAFGLTVGRQGLAFHEERLVGQVDWAPQGRHFDAARVSLAHDALSADVAGAVLAEPDTGLWPDDAFAIVARGGWSPRPAVVADALYVYDADEAIGRVRHTGGLYAKGGGELFSGRVEGYFQGGTVGSGAIAAHMIGVSGTLTPKSKLQPKITLWFDRLSGDADLADTDVTTFDTLFQTGHKFYGRMDLFYPTPADATGRGLHDAALKLQAAPVADGQVNLDVHVFLAAAGTDGHLGEEVDLWWTQTYGKHLRLVAGAAAFLPGDGSDPSTFGWLELGARY